MNSYVLTGLEIKTIWRPQYSKWRQNFKRTTQAHNTKIVSREFKLSCLGEKRVNFRTRVNFLNCKTQEGLVAFMTALLEISSPVWDSLRKASCLKILYNDERYVKYTNEGRGRRRVTLRYYVSHEKVLKLKKQKRKTNKYLQC